MKPIPNSSAVKKFSLAHLITKVITQTTSIVSIIIVSIFLLISLFSELKTFKYQSMIEFENATLKIASRFKNYEKITSQAESLVSKTLRLNSQHKKIDTTGKALIQSFLRQIVDSADGDITGISIITQNEDPITVIHTGLLHKESARIATTSLFSQLTDAVLKFNTTAQISDTLKKENVFVFKKSGNIYATYNNNKNNVSNDSLNFTILVVTPSSVINEDLTKIKVELENKGIAANLNLVNEHEQVRVLSSSNFISDTYSSLLYTLDTLDGSENLFLQGSLIKKDFVFNLLIRISGLLILCLLFILMSFLIIKNKIPNLLAPLKEITTDVENLEKSNFLEAFNISGPTEIEILRHSIETMRKKIILYSSFETQSQIAAQVSHDIRSPLSALNLVIGSIEGVSEEKRVLLRNATLRINDIANDLLTKANYSLVDSIQEVIIYDTLNSITAESQTELASTLIDSLISEKRIQYREFKDLQINLELKNSCEAFIFVNSKEFKRVLSNLINNSVEAMPQNKGIIDVSILINQSDILKNIPTVEINIKDNGKGMSQEILEKIGQIGITSGKESGHGLGLYHAKKTIHSFNGHLFIESKQNEGTLIKISLPLVQAPDWFAQVIDLTNKDILVSVDDDDSIHQIWSERLRISGLSDTITHKKFKCGEDFAQYITNSPDEISTSQFLIDYELIKQKRNGLELIEDFNLGKYSILVTSRHEEENIRQRVKTLNAHLLPKSLSLFVPILKTK